ncbi:hypothetical protein I6M33_18765 [Shewanella algae]|uniref:hypothetical protein n=1 Tax=Shewanella algae TaxID=38313 RepID=UPI001AAD0355|nr:hypothetical protein [Shewanella algae]MBO2562624.1 hypothetical protein [Shewanella algae]MBO2621916.1 hypothetical protein [Shewanella algae]
MNESTEKKDGLLALPRLMVWGRDISKPLMLCILLVFMPFAPELLLFLDLAGIGVAFTCFLIMIKPYRMWLNVQIAAIKTHWLIFRVAIRSKSFNRLIYTLIITLALYAALQHLAVYLWEGSPDLLNK